MFTGTKNKSKNSSDGKCFGKWRAWYFDKECHLNSKFSQHYSIKILYIHHRSNKCLLYRFNKEIMEPSQVWIERILYMLYVHLPMAKKSIHFVESIKWYLKIIMAMPRTILLTKWWEVSCGQTDNVLYIKDSVRKIQR